MPKAVDIEKIATLLEDSARREEELLTKIAGLEDENQKLKEENEDSRIRFSSEDTTKELGKNAAESSPDYLEMGFISDDYGSQDELSGAKRLENFLNSL